MASETKIEGRPHNKYGDGAVVYYYHYYCSGCAAIATNCTVLQCCVPVFTVLQMHIVPYEERTVLVCMVSHINDTSSTRTECYWLGSAIQLSCVGLVSLEQLKPPQRGPVGK